MYWTSIKRQALDWFNSINIHSANAFSERLSRARHCSEHSTQVRLYNLPSNPTIEVLFTHNTHFTDEETEAQTLSSRTVCCLPLCYHGMFHFNIFYYFIDSSLSWLKTYLLNIPTIFRKSLTRHTSYIKYMFFIISSLQRTFLKFFCPALLPLIS